MGGARSFTSVTTIIWRKRPSYKTPLLSCAEKFSPRGGTIFPGGYVFAKNRGGVFFLRAPFPPPGENLPQPQPALGSPQNLPQTRYLSEVSPLGKFLASKVNFMAPCQKFFGGKFPPQFLAGKLPGEEL